MSGSGRSEQLDQPDGIAPGGGIDDHDYMFFSVP